MCYFPGHPLVGALRCSPLSAIEVIGHELGMINRNGKCHLFLRKHMHGDKININQKDQHARLMICTAHLAKAQTWKYIWHETLERNPVKRVLGPGSASKR